MHTIFVQKVLYLYNGADILNKVIEKRKFNKNQDQNK